MASARRIRIPMDIQYHHSTCMIFPQMKMFGKPVVKEYTPCTSSAQLTGRKAWKNV
jgi:hypothetical protein